MFHWIRLKVKNAVLAGFNDAVEVLVRQGADAHDDAQGLLEERVRLLPGPGADREPERTTATRKGKAG